jgi:hypothetical protein
MIDSLCGIGIEGKIRAGHNATGIAAALGIEQS